MAHRWGKNERVTGFIFLSFKITANSDCSHEIKRCLLFGRKAITNLDNILKTRDISQRHHFANKGPYSQSYGVSSSHVWMWELNHKEGWVMKNWCFQIVVLEKTFESCLDSKEIKPVNPKEINPEYSLEGLMLKLKLQSFGHLMWKADSLEKTMMLENIEGRRRRVRQRMRWSDGIINSMNMEFEQIPGDSEGQARLVCCSPWGCKDLDMTEQLNNIATLVLQRKREA